MGNQLALAHSRLWDAVGGFIYVSAQMQDKLSRDPDQLDLLREFLNLQKELMIMLLSMLEGNVVNGPIARQMVDTLAESSAYVEVTCQGYSTCTFLIFRPLYYFLRIFISSLRTPFDIKPPIITELSFTQFEWIIHLA